MTPSVRWRSCASNTVLYPRAWELRHNVTFTDGLYVALAEQLGIPLVTLDARIAATPRIRAGVEVLAKC
ncbi:MAG: type II toxin-antitoxin system VapC family toxin [Actinomycetota bacterium]|nr:type II toxin-antitoxin system VapC family toxin [Actinomycetota bacterium]